MSHGHEYIKFRQNLEGFGILSAVTIVEVILGYKPDFYTLAFSRIEFA
jgi:hypothetical protein